MMRPYDDEPPPTKALSVAPTPPVLIPDTPPQRPLPVEPYWSEMRIVRLVASALTVALTIFGLVYSVKALPDGLVWLPFLVALVPFGLFTVWAWQAQHEAEENARRRAAEAEQGQFRAESNARANPAWRTDT